MSEPKTILDLGFCIMPRAHFFAGNGPPMHCYEGAGGRSLEYIATAHAAQRAALMDRVLELKGEFILWNPDDDAEGYVLVGDDADAIMKEAFDYEMSMRSQGFDKPIGEIA